MHIVENSFTSHGKTYHSVLLRESYREGKTVKKRTVANLSNCKPEEVEAIKLALRYKDNLALLGSVTDSLDFREGMSVGAAWTLYTIAQRCGIERALGADFQGRLALWQVMARALDQGSRLSAVRLAQFHAACDILGMERGFDENDLYENMTWLCKGQSLIEDRLFRHRWTSGTPELFLYDVTSSYLEGQCNELADWGYNRDKKKGKKQIVIGLLCDNEGEPVSTEVFPGNTQDMMTFASQVKKAAERFGCARVTFVGDRGMIKSGQIEDLAEFGFNYITAITKAQIVTLLNKGTLQMELFDENICEVAEDGVRYILRKNPQRAEEVDANRRDKRKKIETLAEKKNLYLSGHPKAKVETALKEVRALTERLKIHRWVTIGAEGRRIVVSVNADALHEESFLDGCYVIKTDLAAADVTARTIHDRYKDLAMVEEAFRTFKTGHLEVQPVNVQTDEHTRAHVLVVMLAYMITRALKKSWRPFDIKVQEGLTMLSTLCSHQVTMNGKNTVHMIPTPRELSAQLLEAADIHLPKALPSRGCKVVTRHKLQNRRKS